MKCTAGKCCKGKHDQGVTVTITLDTLAMYAYVIFPKQLNANLGEFLYDCGNNFKYIFKSSLTVKCTGHNIGKREKSSIASLTHSLMTQGKRASKPLNNNCDTCLQLMVFVLYSIKE